MVAERKPLSLPPPVIFAPRAVHTTLENAHALIPPPLPPTPPPPPYDPTAPLPSAAEILAAAQSDITADLASNGQEQEKESLNPSSAVSEAPTSKPQSLNIKSRVTRAKSESTGLPAKKVCDPQPPSLRRWLPCAYIDRSPRTPTMILYTPIGTLSRTKLMSFIAIMTNLNYSVGGRSSTRRLTEVLTLSPVS